MITNENDFLGLIISCADDNHDCNAIEVIKKSGMSDIDCLQFINSLQAKGLTELIDTETIHIYPQAYEAYVSTSKKVKDSFVKTSKFTFKTLFEIIIGIIVTVVAAFLIYHFGWQ